MRFKYLLLGTALAVASSTGAAEAATGWYLSLGAGLNWVQDAQFTGNTAGGPVVTGNADFNTGYIIAGSAGYDWGHWRAELELAYRNNDVNCVNIGGGGCAAIPGLDMWEFSQMINVFYDFDLGGRWGASLGAGVGGNLVTGQAGLFFANDIDDYVFAGQLMAEVNYQISDRWQIYGNYHFMVMDDPNLSGLGVFGPGGSVDIEKNEHALMIGLRFDLTPDRMAPEPQRPVSHEPPRQFIVFFGFNKSNLSAEAERVVDEAAAAAKQFGSASIMVVGHTDTVGSNGYNMRLSLRRAAAVKAALGRNGISTSMIQTSGKGESELMVDTGDGVKEPQNRRATIDLQ